MRDEGAMKLSHAWQSQEKRGVGCQESGDRRGLGCPTPEDRARNGTLGPYQWTRPVAREPWGWTPAITPGLFANTHSLWGFAGQASKRVRPQPPADRGDEEAATSRVWEGKPCSLPPRHKSTPSNCPREKLLQILPWLVAQLPAAKCPSAQ